MNKHELTVENETRIPKIVELDQRIADLEQEMRNLKLKFSELYMKIVGGEKHE